MSDTETTETTETTDRDTLTELQRTIRRLEAERAAEHDHLRRQSLGIELFALKAALLKEWKKREGR
jgi:hypothetical protein